jgi:3-hydroxy-9,10-secoandrosta-1,3,5(10)-triene-9,17-dione monooxygenase reductase component
MELDLMPVTAKELRQIMRQFATGVTVVTTTRPDGTFYGITVSSFTSVSLQPPLVLICIDKKTEANNILRDNGFFCVNILHENQSYLSDRFAGREPDNLQPFADIALHTDVTGAPIFEDCLGFADCRVIANYDGGDHNIFLAEVLKTGVNDQRDALGREISPLLYFRSNYRYVNKQS